MPITLLPLDVQTAQKLASGDRALYANAANADEIAEEVTVSAQMQVDLYEHNNAVAPWLGYLGYETEGNRVVGICSFRDVVHDGIAEIAFYTFPGLEGQGWGGDMATALVDIALGDPEVDVIVAHTEEGEKTASARILARLGFEHTAIIEDTDEGPIWQWMLERGEEIPENEPLNDNQKPD